jgi:inner membrane protein
VLFWHAGVAAALTYVTLGRRRIDYRFVLVGSVIPDVVDGVLTALGVVRSPAGRHIAHSLLAVVVVAVAVILGLSGTTRLAAFGLSVGWLLHLVGDGMWRAPETFLWPAFGTGFSLAPGEPYSWDLVTEPLAHLGTWAAELAGAALLAWFYVAFRLGERRRLRAFLADGYLRP